MKRSAAVRWGALAVAVVVAAAIGFVVVRMVSPTGRAPKAPTGLSASVKVGHVELAWQPVPGSDRYLLLRDDQVVYAGAEPRGTDATVTKGKHVYRVQAQDHGVPSAMSQPITVEAGEGWGEGAPLVNLLPKLLPAAPRTDGPWEKLHCNWQIRPGRNELGPSEAGAGAVGMRYRLICGSQMKWGLHSMWFYSKDAVDGYLSDVISNAEAFRWNHGSGFYLASRGEGYLKFDDPKLSLIVVGITRQDSKTKAGLIEMANRLPV